MGKKNKMKNSHKSKKSKGKTVALAAEPAADDTGVDGVVDDHKVQMSAIASLPLRVDKQISDIKALQKQLSDLQLQQISLLDECVDFFEELHQAKPKTDEEQKLVLETFRHVKGKMKEMFEDYLPTEVDRLERDMQARTKLSNKLF